LKQNLLKTITLSSILKRFYKIFFILIGLLPVKKKLIIFESYLGKQYSCNPRAIYEYLEEHHPEFEMFWSVDRRYARTFSESNIPYLNRFSLKWLFLLPRAEYWVANSRLPLWFKKPKHTTYLQTWHGTPLKKLASDMKEVLMPGTTTEQYKATFNKESRNWDYLISPNAYSTEIFKRAFQFDKTILETGYPRNDFLLNYNDRETEQEIKETLGIPKDKKVILYAPTWRDNEFFGIGKYKFTLQLDLDQLQQSLGEDYVILLRMHYLIINKLDIHKYNNFVYDLSNYKDIRELYLVSDILITDYSSVFFDYLCLKRPIIFFTYDIETYRDKVRGFYFDIEKEAPGPLVKSTEEVIKAIKQIEHNEQKSSEAVKQFHKKFCSLEKGVSAERVVKSVFLERVTE
jgi:CDP-glycerol glycerophosphotransferase